MFKLLVKLVLSVSFFLFLGFTAFAQSDPIEGFWFNEEKSAKVQIYRGRDSKFYGKIVWLKVPDREGKPKVDDRNPDASKRKQPIVGLVILKGFQADDGDVYDDGEIYDPKNGKTYDCKMTRKGNRLDIRGYVGVPAFGRTTTFTKAD